MRSVEAMLRLLAWAKSGRHVLNRGDLARILGEPRTSRKIESTVSRLVRDRVLVRAARDVYVVSQFANHETLGQIAQVASRGHMACESLETAGAAWGLISQCYPAKVTCVTTGRSIRIECEYGVVELIHTELGTDELIAGSVDMGPARLRMTDAKLTARLLRRTGRASELVREEASKK